jgi:serine-threonine kinase receptor-associated protein
VTGNLGDEWVRVHGMDGEEREVLKGHHGPVHCVEFSPDGEMYASGSGKCSLTLYHTHCKGYSFGVLFTSTIIRGRFVYFLPPVILCLTVKPAGTIRLWQTTPGKTYGLWQGQG